MALRSGIFLGWLGVVAASAASAAVIHVPADQPTIRDGLAIALPGDTVEVACGVYFEHGLFLRPGVVLRSETGLPDCVTIDAEDLGRIAYGASLPTGTSIEGFTFRNGFEPNGRDFDRNFLREEGSRFTAPAPGERDLGGGGALYFHESRLSVRHCRFEDNEALVHGGAVRVQGGEVAFEDVRFDRNIAGNQGGAIYAGTGAALSWLRCALEDNRAKQAGAAYLSYSSLLANESSLGRNQAVGSGGALQLAFGSAALEQCVLFANAAARGGAIAAFGSAEPVTLTNCTLALNRAATGSAISGPAALVRSIVAFHDGGTAVDCALAEVSLECTDVFGNLGGDFVGCLADDALQNGNFSADPAFCDPVGGDFHLVPTSPCLPGSTPCGLQVGALGVGCDPGVGVVVATSPPGLVVRVDDVRFVAPVMLAWAEGTNHTLGVDPLQGDASSRNAFAAWSDGGAATHGIVVPASPIAYTASFTTEHYLEVAATAGGSATPASGWRAEGASVAAHALPNADYVFTRWEGAGAGSYSGPDNPASVVMLGPVTQLARFTFAGNYNLTMTSTVGGSVSPASGPVAAGTIVPILATPDAHFDFVGWQGQGQGSYTGPDASASIVMEADIVQHAEFRRRMHRVTMTASGPGTVSPIAADYPEGAELAIRATANPGYHFVEWIGEGAGSYSGTSAAAAITVDGPISQTAYFSGPATYLLTVTHFLGGTTSPPAGPYPNGAEVVIHAQPDSGYVFTGWGGFGLGSYSGPDATAVVHMFSDIFEHASFRRAREYTLTMLAQEGGGVSPESGVYQEGTLVEIVATPQPEFIFAGWEGSGEGAYSGMDNPATIRIGGNVTQLGRFVPRPAVQITTEPPGKPIVVDGTTYISPASFFWSTGEVHTATVPALDVRGPGEQDRFLRWQDGLTTLSRTITVRPGPNLHVAYYASEVQLSFAGAAGGTATPGDGWRERGSVVRIDAVPDANFVFRDWTGQGEGSYTGPDNPAFLTMNGPIVQAPRFEEFGIELSISASADNPYQNSDVPSQGPRMLHLWATCAPEGLSALQCAVTASATGLEVFGFFPTPGVLSIGGSTQLLLAIGGCGLDTFPRHLGSWAVLDNGGSLCVGPDLDGFFVAVECDSLYPSMLESPHSVGFSSSGAAPCTSGVRRCDNVLALAPAHDGGAPLSPAIAEAAITPEADALRDPAPNPFVDASTLAFLTAHPTSVRLAVHDVSGRLVRILTDGPRAAGRHECSWDGRDESGRPVPSGIYFVRLATSEGYQATRKVMRLRE